VACLIAALWPWVFGHALATPEKTQALIGELHPLASGALFYAAVAGVGLFLSGLVSGFFDNRARYHQLAARIAAAPRLAWLGRARLTSLASYLDAHYGAILGNLFFGMYLGLVGVFGKLTGIPIDIRHVAFSSANVGTALVSAESLVELAPFVWAAAGVIAIALVNLAVSFGLALMVAMRSRGIGSWQAMRLGRLLARDFAARPLSFFAPPEPKHD
jgi:site-specific recombinase